MPSQRHIDSATLALLAGGELPFGQSVRAGWHVRLCARCRAQLERFRRLREMLHAEAAEQTEFETELPGIAWDALEAEMRANIRLGLTAGALAGDETVTQSIRPLAVPLWRWATVCATLGFVLGAGWWLSGPGRLGTPVVSSVLRVTPDLDLTDAAAAPPVFEPLAPASDAVRTEADFSGATRVRLIDADTGRVTLQQVYAQ